MYGTSGGDDSTAVRHKVRMLRWGCNVVVQPLPHSFKHQKVIRFVLRCCRLGERIYRGGKLLCLLGLTSAKIRTPSGGHSPAGISPNTATKKMFMQWMITSLHEAPHIGHVDENYLKLGGSQLLRVLGVCNFGFDVNFAHSNLPLSRGSVWHRSSENKRRAVMIREDKTLTLSGSDTLSPCCPGHVDLLFTSIPGPLHFNFCLEVFKRLPTTETSLGSPRLGRWINAHHRNLEYIPRRM